MLRHPGQSQSSWGLCVEVEGGSVYIRFPKLGRLTKTNGVGFGAGLDASRELDCTSAGTASGEPVSTLRMCLSGLGHCKFSLWLRTMWNES